MKKEITILYTWWSKDIYEIDWNIKDYMNMKTQAKQNWEDWFWSEKYQTFIKFASLEKEQGKTLHLALEEPKKEIRTPEQLKQDRQKLEAIHKKWLEENEDTIKKRFIEKRNKILNDLAKEEKRFWLTSTLFKQEQYNKLKNGNTNK